MKRSTLILGSLVVVLAVATFLVLQKPGEQSSSSVSSGMLFPIDSIAVDKLIIKTPTSTTVLEKHGVEWFVEQPIHYRADQSYIGTVIQQTKNLEVHGVVSSNPQKQPVFQVDSTGIRVTVFEHGTERASFIVGKPAASFTETYVRKSSSNDVFAVGGTVSFTYNRPLHDWRDRTLLVTPRESIKEVRFQYGDTTFALTFADSTWRVGREATNAEAVNALLSSLSNVSADDFADSVAATPKVASQISFGDNQLRFAFRKDLNKYYVQCSASPQWYVFEPWKANQLLKRKKDLVLKK